MKNLLLTSIVLFYSLTAFSQQELQIVNNTGQSLTIFIMVDGTDCPNFCVDNFVTQEFTIGTGTTTLNSLTDFDNLTPPVSLLEGPNEICDPSPTGIGPCTGMLADLMCDNPLWTMIAFSHPGQSTCCMGRIGDTNCGWLDSYSDAQITASWNIVSSTQIVVIFS